MIKITTITCKEVLEILNISILTLNALAIGNILHIVMVDGAIRYQLHEVEILSKLNIPDILGINGCIKSGVEFNRYINKLKEGGYEI